MFVLAFIVITAWLYIVRKQRYKSLDRTISEHEGTKLTPTVAQKVLREFAQYESPFLYGKSLEFALFKTYAIPSISKLLAQTDQLVSRQFYGKRVEDTDVILNTATTFNLNSETSTLAIARMNYIHAQYGSKISNDDLLYTLSLFMMEPKKWHDKFGWRKMHPIEVEANFLLWRAVGERMNIKDIPETFEDLCTWSVEYEEEHMVYADSNKAVSDGSVDLFLRPAPEALKPFGRRVVSALLEPRVLKAFGYESQPAWIHSLLDSIIFLRNSYIRYMCLPATQSAQRIPFEVNADGRINPQHWNFEPYYVKSSLFTRLRAQWLGINYDENTFYSSGFKLDDEVGPKHLFGKGGPEVVAAAKVMRGCPFA